MWLSQRGLTPGSVITIGNTVKNKPRIQQNWIHECNHKTGSAPNTERENVVTGCSPAPKFFCHSGKLPAYSLNKAFANRRVPTVQATPGWYYVTLIVSKISINSTLRYQASKLNVVRIKAYRLERNYQTTTATPSFLAIIRIASSDSLLIFDMVTSGRFSLSISSATR